MVLSLRLCIDVPELERGIAFYTAAFGLTVARRLSPRLAELAGGPCPIDLLEKPEGSAPSANVTLGRHYGRHWTPLHLDVVVEDAEAAVARAVAAGARIEQPMQTHPWGKLTVLSDPFGHGLCVVQFLGRGYDEVAAPSGG